MDNQKALLNILVLYEIASSWWARHIGFKWGQKLAGNYFAREVRRKWNYATPKSRADMLAMLTEAENAELQRTKAALMDAYSLIGQYRSQRDTLLKAAESALVNLNISLDKWTPSRNAASSALLRLAISLVKHHDHSPDTMMLQRDELMAAIGKLKPGYSAEEFAELAAVYQKVKEAAV